MKLEQLYSECSSERLAFGMDGSGCGKQNPRVSEKQVPSRLRETGIIFHYQLYLEVTEGHQIYLLNIFLSCVAKYKQQKQYRQDNKNNTGNIGKNTEQQQALEQQALILEYHIR
ncbi:Hypothetical_protein [Hexamita inflata]|uniref:Hypothetical_protein n=1 Tax=Hexamita inflata TaxID=28002 RepID=A0AA86QJC8_9EUKA|nr:Hypothetical protein HINF_LOCUS45042 [Hexamita inflata]